MAGWSRREVLAALAAGAASAPGLSALLGCGGARSAPAAPPALPRPPAMADLREQLRQVHADLAGRFRAVSVRAEVGRLTRAVVEPEERSFDELARSSLSLAGFDGTIWFEETAADLGPAAIARAAKVLAALGGRGGAARATPESPPRGPVLRLDPRGRPARDWLDRAARLHERSTRMGSSRIVYRVASLEVDDADVLFLGDGHERSQRLVRARSGALFLAWTGSAITGEEAVRAGAVGLEVTELADDALARAAEDALTLLTSGQIPPGLRDLVLDPSVAALLVREAARGFEADAWGRGGARAAGLAARPLGSTAITLRDDPRAAAYGGYRFDDEGWPGAPVELIERGVVRGPLVDAASAAALGRARTGHGRRTGPLEPVAPRASHLILSTGPRTRDELVATVGEQGYLVEGGVEASGDPHAWRVAVRARRAREIAGGRLTGRVYGPVVVAGDVPGLFGAVRGLGRDAEVHAWRETASRPPASVSAPSLATRGWLGGG